MPRLWQQTYSLIPFLSCPCPCIGRQNGGRIPLPLVYHQRAVGSRSWDIRLLVRDVERLVCCVILIHLDCKVEPGFQVCIGRSSVCHSHEGHRDSAVKASAELDHNSFWIGVSGIINQVPELVEVVVDRPLALKVGSHLQDVDGSRMKSFRNSSSKSSQSMKRRQRVLTSCSNLRLAQRFSSCPW